MRAPFWLLVAAAGPVGAGPLAFVDEAVDAGAGADGVKFAGAAFGDLDGDGCYALAVNRDGAPPALYRSDCARPPSYVDVTAQLAPGLGPEERALAWGDLDHDGRADLVRSGWSGTASAVEISFSHGWSAPLGDAGSPSAVIDRSNGAPMNLEGLGLVDFDADGWLDVMVQHEGIRLWRNPADGGASMEEVTTPADPRGLPLSDFNGDYATVADYDDDGDVDLLVRTITVPALWENLGGHFAANASFTNRTEEWGNLDKGGVAFCDFDSDGLLDIFWSSPASVVADAPWRQGPVGTFTAQAPLAGVLGNVEGMACGDVDNDGDPDLLLTTVAGEQLYLNVTAPGGSIQLEPQPQRFGSGATWSAVLLDEDRDGDLDAYVNRDGPNSLWRSSLDDARAVELRARRALPGGLRRDDLGATVRLETCEGALASGVQSVSGGNGRGSQDSPRLHFGLAGRSDAALVARVRFVGGKVVRHAFRTAGLKPATVIDVASDAEDDLTACDRGLFAAGCGCAQAGGPAGALVLLVAGLLARARRRGGSAAWYGGASWRPGLSHSRTCIDTWTVRCGRRPSRSWRRGPA